MKKQIKYAVTIVNTETGECRAFLTDHYEAADERAMLAEGTEEIVFVNEFKMAPVHPKVKDASTAY
jgi:acyl-CoA thioesterase FadM